MQGMTIGGLGGADGWPVPEDVAAAPRQRPGREAGVDDLRRVFRHLARVHHPDRNAGDPAATRRFREIRSAYETLEAQLRAATPSVARARVYATEVVELEPAPSAAAAYAAGAAPTPPSETVSFLA